jgi:hypothetical protein
MKRKPDLTTALFRVTRGALSKPNARGRNREDSFEVQSMNVQPKILLQAVTIQQNCFVIWSLDLWLLYPMGSGTGTLFFNLCMN